MKHPIPITLTESERASLQMFIHAGKADAEIEISMFPRGSLSRRVESTQDLREPHCHPGGGTQCGAVHHLVALFLQRRAFQAP